MKKQFLRKSICVLLSLLLTASLLCCGAVTAFASGEEDAEETSGEVLITLSDAGSACVSEAVTVEGDTVTIAAAGTYRVTGTLSEGQLVVAAPKDAKVKLVLDGAAITCTGSAAILALSADRLTVSAAAGSENSLRSKGAFYKDDKVDAALYAKCDLTLSGEGALTVVSDKGHGIVTKDDLRVKGGEIGVTAAKKGVEGKDSVSVEGGVLNADVGTDGICSDNEEEGKGTITVEDGTINLLCQKDGLDASGDITVSGGTLVISAGSENEGKGIKSDADITVSGGSLSVSSIDDAVHAGGSVSIGGGELLLSSGDDGVHADSALSISGGSVTVSQSYEGLEAQVITISGGTIRVNARDDGFNAAGGNDGSNSGGFFGGDRFDSDSDASLTIAGGIVYVNAEGDGLDSNGYLYVRGGTVYVSGPTNSGNGALDYGIDGVISGGTIVAVGAAGMAENFGQNSSQASILVNLSSMQAAGSTVSLLDSAGNTLVSFEPEKSYSSVVISTDALTVGESYTLIAGTETQTITLSSLIYGSGGMMGGMMGHGGGRGQGGFGGWQGQQAPDGSDGQPGMQMPGGGMGPMGGFGRP